VSSGNQKSAFQYLTLPITASDVTFATGSLFNFPMILSRPLVGIWHASIQEMLVHDELEHQWRIGRCASRA
jgi:hypothetical protein